MNNNGVYAIYDKIADAYVGNDHQLMVMKHPAAAVRLFQDVLKDERTNVNKHPEDYEMHRLGFLEGNTLKPDFEVVLTGAAWLSVQPPVGQPQLVKES